MIRIARRQLPLREEIRTWTTFLGEMRSALDEQRPKQGAGLRFLTETVTSPTLACAVERLSSQNFLPAKWHQYEPANRDNARAGVRFSLLASRSIRSTTSIRRNEFFHSMPISVGAPGTLRYARQFAAGRASQLRGKHEMSRLLCRGKRRRRLLAQAPIIIGQ